MSRPLVSREMLRDGAFRSAVVALAVAVVVLVAAGVGALRIAPIAAAPPPPAIADSALRFALAGAGADIATAVASDLFTDDRQAPPRRYRLPGEPETTPRVQAPRPAVLGTAIAADGASFAICQITGGQPTVVRAGAKIGEFTVVSIERGRVSFRAADGERFSIDASKPDP